MYSFLKLKISAAAISAFLFELHAQQLWPPLDRRLRRRLIKNRLYPKTWGGYLRPPT